MQSLILIQNYAEVFGVLSMRDDRVKIYSVGETLFG